MFLLPEIFEVSTVWCHAVVNYGVRNVVPTKLLTAQTNSERRKDTTDKFGGKTGSSSLINAELHQNDRSLNNITIIKSYSAKFC